MSTIELDGSQGEGGGQILRTALALSMITGKTLRLERIRARRSKPGLLRQHLTAVLAAAKISHAQLSGAELGSTKLVFKPGKINAGDYVFAIGSAGSCALVLQTVLPALWFADQPSEVRVSGGTHNPSAPSVEFLQRVWLPLLRRMGVDVHIDLLRHGFYPAGGGEVRARVSPCKALQPLHIGERGECRLTRAISIVAGVPVDVAQRELAMASTVFPGLETELRDLPAHEGPGNVLMIEQQYEEKGRDKHPENLCEIFTSIGARKISSEEVARRAAREAQDFAQSGASVDEHLADQLLLPIALAGAGSFSTTTLSAHLKTNAEVIEKFLPLRFVFSEAAGLAKVSL